MIATELQADAYVADFEQAQKESVGEPSWLRELRREALDSFVNQGFPTTHDEQWRFTNVAPIAKGRFELAQRFDIPAPQIFSDANCIRLIFVNGRLAGDIPGQQVVAGSLRKELGNDSAREQLIANPANQPFRTLNTAFFEDGAFVKIPKGVILDRPLHLVFVSVANSGPSVSHPRNLILIGAEAQATIVESYVGLGDGVYFTNTVTTLVAGEGAVVDHYRFQDERLQAFHIGSLEVRQARSSTVTTNSLSFGGALVRNDITAVLAEGSEATLNGLYIASGRQHVDHHTALDHAKPHAASHEFYKGVLDGRSSAVFNGKIIVRKDAQKTDAKQTNKNLVLSEDATINTTPQLEIYADDVRCTHGATVGQLDPEALFYLRSRGIGGDEARNVLTLAFARDVIDRVKVPALREHLDQLVLARLSKEAR